MRIVKSCKALVVVLALSCSAHASPKSSPYIQGLWTQGNPIYLSQGVTYSPTNMDYDRSFTNVAWAYHPLSSGSLWDLPWLKSREPEWLSTYLPREAWAATLGISYAPSSSSISETGVNGLQGGPGFGFNLADTARQELYTILSKFDNATVEAVAAQINPAGSKTAIFVSRQWDSTINQPFKLAPRWFFGAGYGF